MIDLVEKWDKGVLQQSSSSKVTYYVRLTFQSSFQKNSGTVEIRKVLFFSTSPYFGLPRFSENVRKRTRLWKSALCDANGSGWGFVPPYEAGSLFFCLMPNT